jgi:hypothetical protein
MPPSKVLIIEFVHSRFWLFVPKDGLNLRLQKSLGYWIDRKFHHAEMNPVGVVLWPATIITDALAKEDFLAPSISLYGLSARAHYIHSFSAGTATCFFCF